jgi:hypothetical protein
LSPATTRTISSTLCRVLLWMVRAAGDRTASPPARSDLSTRTHSVPLRCSRITTAAGATEVGGGAAVEGARATVEVATTVEVEETTTSSDNTRAATTDAEEAEAIRSQEGAGGLRPGSLQNSLPNVLPLKSYDVVIRSLLIC